MTEPVEPRQEGRISGLLTAVKGLTVTNALVILLLVVALIPAYVIYKTINDASLLDRFLSEYREHPSGTTNCIVRSAKLGGGPLTYSIATSFAAYGADRWMIGVVLQRQPNEGDLNSYCATLNLLVDYLRDPSGETPTFPGTDKPVVRQYNEQR